MSAILVGLAYAIAGFSAPFALVPRIATPSFLARCLAVWFLTALILFFMNDFLIVLIFSGLVLAMLAPADSVQRTCFFFVAVPSLPVYLQVALPFPGINWLIMLTYYKVVVLVVLGPLLFRPRPQEQQGGYSVADTCVVLYIILTVVLVTVAMGFTAGPRFLIDQLLLLAIPYFVLSRFVRSSEDLELCFRAILLVSLMLASIAIVATLKQWDFYRLKEPLTVFIIPDIRSGLIRIAATANTHSLGYHLAIGFLFLEYLKKPLQLGIVRLWLFRGMFLAGIMSTDSRGAMLSLAVALFVYFVVMIRKPAVRWAMLISLTCIMIIGGVWLVTMDDATGVDPYNSVGYRQLLLEIGIQHVLQYPVFGDLFFLKDPSFAPLRQGQGIIDITNFYLQIALCFGLAGLFLFGMAFIPTLWKLMRVISRSAGSSSDDRQNLRRMSALILSASLGWFVLIVTTSDVALTLHLGLMLITLGCAVVRFEASRSEFVAQQADRRSLSMRGLAYRIRPAGSTGG